MNKIINYTLLFFLFLLPNCAYEPVLKNKNYQFSINIIKLNGDQNINSIITNNVNNLKEEEILNIAKNLKLLDKYLNNKKINKVIFIKNRLINILVNE